MREINNPDDAQLVIEHLREYRDQRIIVHIVLLDGAKIDGELRGITSEIVLVANGEHRDDIIYRHTISNVTHNQLIHNPRSCAA